MEQTLKLRLQLSNNFRYCYSSRRATQTMSASRYSPTIGLNRHASPLAAVTVSLHYLPRCLCSAITCGKTPITVIWRASAKVCCHVVVTQQRPIAEQFAPEFHNLPLYVGKRADMSEAQAIDCMLPKQRIWLLSSVSVISANNCHCKN